jgi:hypothetical protein
VRHARHVPEVATPLETPTAAVLEPTPRDS